MLYEPHGVLTHSWRNVTTTYGMNHDGAGDVIKVTAGDVRHVAEDERMKRFTFRTLHISAVYRLVYGGSGISGRCGGGGGGDGGTRGHEQRERAERGHVRGLVPGASAAVLDLGGAGHR